MPFWAIIALLFVLSWLVWLLLVPRLLKARGVDVRRTRFGFTLVFDSTDADGTAIRLLNVGGVYQSVCYIDDDLQSELTCLYHRSFAEAIHAKQHVSRVLVLGGGGFSLPKYLISHCPQICVDVVEIDPCIIQLAREKFFLNKLEQEAGERLQVICADAWEWLASVQTNYDVIINDAFSGKKPLGPMATDEGAALVKAHLCNGGLYLANVRSSLVGRKRANLDEAHRAFSNYFSHVYLVPERPDKPSELAYNAFVASDEPAALAGAQSLS